VNVCTQKQRAKSIFSHRQEVKCLLGKRLLMLLENIILKSSGNRFILMVI